jgi:hypothetical protein
VLYLPGDDGAEGTLAHRAPVEPRCARAMLTLKDRVRRRAEARRNRQPRRGEPGVRLRLIGGPEAQ